MSVLAVRWQGTCKVSDKKVTRHAGFRFSVKTGRAGGERGGAGRDGMMWRVTNQTHLVEEGVRLLLAVQVAEVQRQHLHGEGEGQRTVNFVRGDHGERGAGEAWRG